MLFPFFNSSRIIRFALSFQLNDSFVSYVFFELRGFEGTARYLQPRRAARKLLRDIMNGLSRELFGALSGFQLLLEVRDLCF